MLAPYLRKEIMTSNKQAPVDGRVLALYNDYAHGRIDRREFVRRVSALAITGFTAAALIRSVMPDYAKAQQVMFTDPRIRGEYVEYPSPQGSGMMRGYLVHPLEVQGPAPTVVVFHENRGLNPYIEDVARRAATQGFMSLAPDGLAPLGGYPGNDDAGREMQASLDADKLNQDMIASARFLKAREGSNGRLGATGFCWGGGMTNRLAVALGADLNAAAPFYGAAVPADQVPMIQAPLMLQYAAEDMNINGQAGPFQEALRANNKDFVAHTYPGTMHGFHNDSTPRFVPEQARIAEQRMWDFFRQHLSA